ncbi:MAG: Endo-beta-N-acetylglucosaminidase [Sphingobacterium sp.]|jgi:hypothetical protein|nr:Endo-beta-N-acetylglucosaminidase [Sphingobacterium sp.]
MKNYNIRTLLLATVAILFLFSCKKTYYPPESVITKGSPAYYEALRNYKKTNHQIAFGWVGGLDEATPGAINAAEEIPDSMDIVTCWYMPPVSGTYAVDLIHKVQKLKGTRFLYKASGEQWFFEMFANEKFMEDYANKGDAKLREGFALVTKHINDTITRLGLDGIDVDQEPHYNGNWGISSDNKVFSMFIEELSKYFGPLSGTGRLLTVNGEIYELVTERSRKAIDYGIEQAYDETLPSDLQERYNRVSSWLAPSKYIPTTNFEGGNRTETGGGTFNLPQGTFPALLGYAYWQPTQGRKGGAGAYHPEYDKGYKFMRQAIQIMNPATK